MFITVQSCRFDKKFIGMVRSRGLSGSKFKITSTRETLAELEFARCGHLFALSVIG